MNGADFGGARISRDKGDGAEDRDQRAVTAEHRDRANATMADHITGRHDAAIIGYRTMGSVYAGEFVIEEGGHLRHPPEATTPFSCDRIRMPAGRQDRAQTTDPDINDFRLTFAIHPLEDCLTRDGPAPRLQQGAEHDTNAGGKLQLLSMPNDVAPRIKQHAARLNHGVDIKVAAAMRAEGVPTNRASVDRFGQGGGDHCHPPIVQLAVYVDGRDLAISRVNDQAAFIGISGRRDWQLQASAGETGRDRAHAGMLPMFASVYRRGCAPSGEPLVDGSPSATVVARASTGAGL